MSKGQDLLEAFDDQGEVGFLDLAAKTSSETEGDSIAVRLGDGTTVVAAPSRFSETQPGKYRFDGSFTALRRENLSANQINIQPNTEQQNLAAIDVRTNAAGQIVVPLIAEEIKISKKTVETGGVRVHKIVREDVQTIDEPIIREHLDIERVEINQFVETAPAIRYEGDVMIVPVLEEVVVTQKRLLLREEIRLVKRREEISNVQEITLRREEISLEKIDTENTASDTPEAVK